MRYALAAILSLVAAPAFAVSVSMQGLIELVIDLLIIGFVGGILIFLINKAPFIPAEWKSVIIYVVYFIGAIFLINLLLGLGGHSFITLR